MLNRMPKAKGIISGVVIIVVVIRQSIYSAAAIVYSTIATTVAVTLEAEMFLTTYYLSLLRVHQPGAC
jgi:hypothetical protein